MLNQGAELDTQTSVRNPLFSAAIGRSPAIVKLLLKAGIDYSVRYNSETLGNMDAIAFSLLRGEKVCAHIIASWDTGNDEVKARSLLRKADEVANQNAGSKKA